MPHWQLCHRLNAHLTFNIGAHDTAALRRFLISFQSLYSLPLLALCELRAPYFYLPRFSRFGR